MTDTEFETNDEAEAFERLRDEMRRTLPLSPYARMRKSWDAAREYFNRPTSEGRVWIARGDTVAVPVRIVEKFETYERERDEMGIDPTQIGIFAGGYNSGVAQPPANHGPHLGLATNKQLFDELRARLFLGHTHRQYATVTENNSLSPVEGWADPVWFLQQAKRLVESIEGVPEDDGLAINTSTEPDFAGIIETAKQTGGAVEIAGVKIQPCDTYGRTAEDKLLRARAVELAVGLVAQGRIELRTIAGDPGQGLTYQFDNPVELAGKLLSFMEGRV